MIEGVELRRRDVQGPFLGIAVEESIVDWEQVHVVHGNVVAAVTTEDEANVEQRGSVEPGWKV